MIRSHAEQCRIQERLLMRGNTLAVTASQILRLLMAGQEVDGEVIEDCTRNLVDWARDVRAVASEERP